MSVYHVSLQREGRASEVADNPFADLDSAREEALRSAREILMNAVKGSDDDVPHAVVVTDETGREVFIARLIDLIPSSLRS